MVNRILIVVLSTSLLLSGCSSFSGVDGIGAGTAENFAADSGVSAALTGTERSALKTAFLKAIDGGQSQRWQKGQANGAIKPGSYQIANLKPHPDHRIRVSRADLDLSYVMETDLGLHVLTRNSNIRIGPGTENDIAEVIPSGVGVDVVGQVSSKPWMLVASEGVVRGFVHESLIVKAPGADIVFAGGPERIGVLCRDFMQKLATRAGQDEWEGTVCRENGRWQLAPKDPTLIADDELLDQTLDGF